MFAAAFFEKRRVFALIFVAWLAAAMLSVGSVAAASITVSVTPDVGPVGSSVKVSGENASSHSEVRVYLDGFAFLASTMANGAGHYSMNFTVPELPARIYDFMVLDVTTGDTNSASFRVLPSIFLSPVEGSFDDLVTVEGYGFRAYGAITVTFNETDVTPSPNPWSDMLGSFKTSFHVPSLPKGDHQVTVSDEINNASATFSITPKITLSQTSGVPSTLIMVTGRGFASFSKVSVMFNAFNVTSYFGVTTWLDGSFTAMFFVPEVSEEDCLVNATDEAGNWATAPFQVSAPFMILTPDTAVGSSIVTANGWGFPPNTPILLYLEDLMLVDLVDLFSGGQALLTDEYGFYNFSFVIPVVNPGTYAVTAYRMETPGGLQRGETVATASLTVVENPLLTEANARLVGLEGTVATINSTLGVFQTNLANIELNVTAIKGDTATIETTLGTIEGRIVSIEGDTATIETEVGTVKADVGAVMADVSKANDTLETFIIPLYIGLALALIAAVGAIILVIMHANALRKTSTKSVNS